MEKPFSFRISENMCLRCILLPSSFRFFKISRSSEEDERHKVGEGRQEARMEGGVEVDEKW